MPKKKPDLPPKRDGKDVKVVTTARDSLRETVESIVIAFVLAFLFRTFEAEAFVIPTGSMAPTLMGRHKDVACSNCGYRYRVSASDEEPRGGGDWPDAIIRRSHEVRATTCPICRYEMHFGPGDPDEAVPHQSFKGDRILVAKFPYEFGEPKRFDVAVFKNPGRGKENYIKRIAGLPNESLVICHGDVLTARSREAQDHVASVADDYRPAFNAAIVTQLERKQILQIERKPPAKVEAMLQVVHDNNYLPRRLPARWSTTETSVDHWERIDEGTGFRNDGGGDGEAMAAYQHLVPSIRDWEALEENPRLTANDLQIEPQLISDFYAYNTGVTRDADNPDTRGVHWVGDLAIECRVTVDGDRGDLLFVLVEGGYYFRCRIDVATGNAELSIANEASFGEETRKLAEQTAATKVIGPGTHRVRFANVDDQLHLWVDGGLVISFPYAPLVNILPTDADLSPVHVGSRGVATQFRDLRVLRDVYYVSFGDDDQWSETPPPPRLWPPMDHFGARYFSLAEDQFLVLGDNSPRSSDSRMWAALGVEHYVKRDLLVGKALFIYWPHALPTPGFPNSFPFIPNLPRMGFVR